MDSNADVRDEIVLNWDGEDGAGLMTRTAAFRKLTLQPLRSAAK